MAEVDESEYEPLTDDELAQIADSALVEMDKEEEAQNRPDIATQSE
jgi:hypothetical protein